MRLCATLIMVLCWHSGFTAQSAPTFGDLAVVIAKGYFQGHVSQDAPVEDCVSFLNGSGVCFSLFDVMDSNIAVGKEDFARAVGRSTLLFTGEAELSDGCIELPKESGSWVDFCFLNDVTFTSYWDQFLQRTKDGMLPEVKKFFGRAL
jgi:hypothetical protein